MSADKYPCILSRHMEAIVYIFMASVYEVYDVLLNTNIYPLMFNSFLFIVKLATFLGHKKNVVWSPDGITLAY